MHPPSIIDLSNIDGGENTNPSLGLRSYQKTPGLWYDDGNVAFRSGTREFRLYKGILCAQSQKLRDLIASAENNYSSHRKNVSYPVIMLPDDENEVCHFFSAIFNPLFYMPPPSKHALHTTISIMRLAQKYEVPYLVWRALLHLDLAFPSKQDCLQNFTAMLQKTLPYITEPSTVVKDILELILLVDSLSVDAKWMIPRFLYITILLFELSNIIAHPLYPRLTHHRQCTIHHSLVNLAMEVALSTSWAGMLPSASCENQAECAYVSRTVQEQDNKIRPRPETNLKAVVVNLDLTVGNGKVFCRSCRAVGTKHWKDLRDAYWNRYAEICGFKSWEEVEHVRSKALALC